MQIFRENTISVRCIKSLQAIAIMFNERQEEREISQTEEKVNSYMAAFVGPSLFNNQITVERKIMTNAHCIAYLKIIFQF